MARRLIGTATVAFGSNGNGGNPGSSGVDAWSKRVPLDSALADGERFDCDVDVFMPTKEGLTIRFGTPSDGMAIGYCSGKNAQGQQLCPPFLDCHNLFALPFEATIRAYGVID